MPLLGKCIAVLDRSFFLEHQECISAHWKFAHEKKVIEEGEFVAKAKQYLQSTCAVEVCVRLGILSSIEDALTEQTEARINLMIGSDCQSAMHKFNARQKVTSFNSKLSKIIREFF